MRWPFRRDDPQPMEWYHIDRAAPFALAAEMAGWPEPIDVIRDICGLPPRLTVAVGRAWAALLAAIAAQQPYQQFTVAYWKPIEHPTRDVVVVNGETYVYGGGPLGRPGRRGAPPIGPYR